MDAAERATARARALALVGDLFASGLRPDSLEAWRQVPGLGVALPEVLDEDEAAALHVHLTQVELFPFESAFLDEGGLLGGDVAAAVRARRARAGLGEPRGLEADHLAEELRLLSFLAGAEAQARQDRQASAVDNLRQHQAEILDQHLLRWLPAFVLAVEGVPAAGDGALYATAARLSLDLAVAWRAELPGPAPAWELPALRPGLLEEEQTGLGRIARRLCTPALAGAFLSSAALRRIGRGLDLPGGFGKRWQVLEGLLASAAHYQAVPAALAALDAELARFEAGYRALEEAVPQAVAPWIARVAESRALVAEMGRAAG